LSAHNNISDFDDVNLDDPDLKCNDSGYFLKYPSNKYVNFAIGMENIDNQHIAETNKNTGARI